MTITNGYVTLARFKAFAEVGSGTSKDAEYERFIESASRHVDRMTNRRFFATTLINKFVDCHSTSSEGIRVLDNCIWFPCGNLSISSIHEDGVALVENTDYWINQTHIEKASCWTSARRNPSTGSGIKINGSFGYSESTAPYDLQQAVLEIAKMFAQEAKRELLQEGDIESVFITKSIPAYVQKWLQGQRRHS